MYIGVRYILGFALSVVAMLVAMPRYISYLSNRDINQVTSDYALDEFKNKAKTPIMGGLLFVLILEQSLRLSWY